MNITNYLKKFFVENNVEAAIPSLGVFYVESQEGTPVPIILFKEKLPKSKAFLNFVAFEENLTEQEALDGIEDWVKGILKDLKASGVVNIVGLGTFEIEEGKVEFFPSPEQFSSDDVFGLENKESDELIVEEEGVQPQKTQKRNVTKRKVSKRKVYRLLLLVLIILVAAIAVWFLLPLINNMLAPKAPIEITLNAPDADAVLIPDESETYVDTETEDELIAKAVVEGEVKRMEQSKQIEKKEVSSAKPTPAKTEAKETKPAREVKSKTPPPNRPAEVAKTKIQSKENARALRYYIIADAFAVKENAEKRKRELNDKTYTVEILHDAQKNLYMVSVKSFTDMDEALNFKAIVRDQKGIPCWIYKK